VSLPYCTTGRWREWMRRTSRSRRILRTVCRASPSSVLPEASEGSGRSCARSMLNARFEFPQRRITVNLAPYICRRSRGASICVARGLVASAQIRAIVSASTSSRRACAHRRAASVRGALAMTLSAARAQRPLRAALAMRRRPRSWTRAHHPHARCSTCARILAGTTPHRFRSALQQSAGLCGL